MAKDPYAIPTADDLMKKAMRDATPKELRVNTAGTAGTPGADKRKRPGVTIDEINAKGAAAVKDKWPELDAAKEGLKQAGDQRSGLEKALDWIDVPRNAVANVIGSMVGVDKEKLPEATFGKHVGAGDILGKLGVQEGALRSVLGFIGDVAIDPLTYATAGAGTGVKIGRGALSMLPKGMEALESVVKTFRATKDGAKAIEAARAVPGLAKALEGIDLAAEGGHTAKSLAAAIYDHAAHLGNDVGDGARLFLTTKGHAVQGRQLFRLPFTNISGPTLPIGQQAKEFKALGNVSDAEKAAMRQVTGAKAVVAAKTTEAAKAEEAAVKAMQGPTPDPVAAANATKQAQTATMAKVAADQEIIKGKSALPEVSKLAERISLGNAYDKETQPLRWAIHQKLGNAFSSSPFRQRFIAVMERLGIGAGTMKRATFQKFEPAANALADDLIKKGAFKSRQEAYDAFSHWMDLSSAAKDDTGKLAPLNTLLHQTDPGDQVWAKVAPLFENNPAAVKLRDAMFAAGQKWAQQEGKAGVGKLGEEIGDYYGRSLDPETAKLKRAQSNVVRGLGAGTAGEGAEYFANQRVRLHEAADAAGQTKVFAATPEEAEKMAGKGFTLTGKSFPVSRAYHEQQYANGAYRQIVGDVEKAGKSAFFESNPAKVMAARAAAHERAMGKATLQKLVNAEAVVVTEETRPLLQKAGMQTIDKLSPENPLYDLLGDKLGKIAVPRPVAWNIEQLEQAFGHDSGKQATNMLLRASDMTLGWFKRWALFAPPYLIRNLWQHAFGCIMEGGNPISAAKWGIGKDANEIWRAVLANTVDDLKGTVKIGTRELDKRELAQFFLDYNGAMAGKAASDVPEWFAKTGKFAEAVRPLAKPVGAAANLVRHADNTMMGHMRLGNWFHFIEKGMAPREAMMRTLLAMPDMSNITVFEKNVMTKIWPWMRWMRTNGALQICYHLPNSPEFMAAAGRFPHALEGLSALWRGDAANIPEELRPEWMREGGAGQVLGDDKQGSVFMARNWFPFEEPMVLATALASPQQGLGMAANQLRPGIKFGMETAFGQDLFRHRPITPFSLQEVYEHPSILPKALIGGSGTSLDQLGTMRPLREIRRVAEQPTLSGEAARVFTGGGIQNIDAAKAAEATDRDLNRQLSELRVKYLRAEENRDEVEQQSILRKMYALKAKRQSLGFKNPKGTQQALAGVGVTQ